MQTDGQNFFLTLLKNSPPKYDELELSVFGRGFGECIVLCCGYNEFVVVDSFINGQTKNPIALDYLNAVGVSAKAIKEVVITHWHQDHIAGISKVLEQAGEDVKVVLNPIVGEQKFNDYLAYAFEQGNETLNEFIKVYQFADKNPNNFIVPVKDKRIYSNEKLNTAEIHTLSPQDREITKYINDLRLINNHKSNTLYLPKENLLSLVLLVEFNGNGVLLGGDMENSPDKSGGWDAIVSNYTHTRTRSSVFKVPHHGSDTGFNENVWNNLLTELPISILTEFNKNKLPTKEAVDRLISLSQRLYIIGGDNKRNKELERKINKIDRTKSITSVSTNIGCVRYRQKLAGGEPTIEWFGAVTEKVNPKYIKSN